MYQSTFHLGGGLTIRQTPVTEKKVLENTVTIFLAVWLTFDKLSCNFENIGGHDAPTTHLNIPDETYHMDLQSNEEHYGSVESTKKTTYRRLSKSSTQYYDLSVRIWNFNAIVHNYMKSWVEFFQKFNSQGVGIRMSWMENFGKNNQQGGRLSGTKEY